MRLRFHGPATAPDGIRNLVEEKADSLDRRLSTIQEDLKLLDVSLHHYQRTDTWEGKLVLRVLNAQIPATGKGTTPLMAVREAFDDMNDELDAYLASLRHEPTIRKQRISQRLAREAILPGDYVSG